MLHFTTIALLLEKYIYISFDGQTVRQVPSVVTENMAAEAKRTVLYIYNCSPSLSDVHIYSSAKYTCRIEIDLKLREKEQISPWGLNSLTFVGR